MTKEKKNHPERMETNVNENKYTESSLDIKLLYVAITRAMSKLDIYYIGNKSKLLNI